VQYSVIRSGFGDLNIIIKATIKAAIEAPIVKTAAEEILLPV
jgi:hypothetical protein